MKIEAGKYYRTRGGAKEGPMTREADQGRRCHGWRWRGPHFGTYREDGIWSTSHAASPFDLIAEWADPVPEAPPSPVRTTTKTVTEIVPGTYGQIGVGAVDGGFVRICFLGQMADYIELNATLLREAAATFNALADAVDSIAEERQA